MSDSSSSAREARPLRVSAERVFELGGQAQAICYTTDEHRQAVQAFLKK